MDSDRRRDGVLAGAALAGLLALLARRGDLPRLRDPVAALSGVGTALLVEWTFLRYPDRLLAAWDHRAVNGGSTLAVLVGGLLMRRRARLLATACWGLLTYFGLIGWLIARNSAR